MMGLLPSLAKAQPPAPAPSPAATPSAVAYPPGYPAPAGYAPAPGQPAPGAPPPGYYPPYAQPGFTPPPAEPKREPSFFVGSLSAGFGVPYGVLGGAINLGMDYVTLMAGGGSSLVAGAGYAFGLRAYVLDTSHKLRPHLTAVYGITGAYKITGSVDLKGTLRGFGFFAGLDHDVGQPGEFFLTYGLGYITHEDLPESVKSLLSRNGEKEPSMGTPIKFMFAIGYRFGGK